MRLPRHRLRAAPFAPLALLALLLPPTMPRPAAADPTTEPATQPTTEPATKPAVTYAGREADAPWRAEADARIESIRKADLVVRVEAVDGRPAPGAAVAVRLTRHAFGFGTAVTSKLITEAGPDSDAYRERLAELFNKAVFENELKWTGYDPLSADPEEVARGGRIDAAIDWLRDRGIAVRGHTMVWPGRTKRWRVLPQDVIDAADAGDLGRVRARVAGRIASIGARFRGRVAEWDVLNEPVEHHLLQDVLGSGAAAEWFRLARAAAPDAALYLNDFTMFYGGGRQNQADAFYANVRDLIDRGAPIDGIGEQGHFYGTPPGPERILAALDRFAAFGLPIQITEFDFQSGDRQLQADFTRDFYTAAFSHPAVEGVMAWGFWAGRHWRPGAAMFAEDWTPRPSADAYRDLVLNRWRTTAEGVTGDDGSFGVRGFLGDYEVTVTPAGGSPVVRTATLAKGGGSVVVRVGG